MKLPTIFMLLSASSSVWAEDTNIQWRLDSKSQAAGTPNRAGIGAIVMLSSDIYLDFLGNANFSDIGNNSSLEDTKVAGTSLSTSTRFGKRWAIDNNIYDINFGYDTRQLKTGNTDNGVAVTDKKDVFFHQLAFSASLLKNSLWGANTYALIPIGNTEKEINSQYNGEALNTYGLDLSHNLGESVNASLGYYYQDGHNGGVDGSGVRGGFTYKFNNQIFLSPNISYDDAFKTHFSLDLTYQFGKPKRKFIFAKNQNRDVRVQGACPNCTCNGGACNQI